MAPRSGTPFGNSTTSGSSKGSEPRKHSSPNNSRKRPRNRPRPPCNRRSNACDSVSRNRNFSPSPPLSTCPAASCGKMAWTNPRSATRKRKRAAPSTATFPHFRRPSVFSGKTRTTPSAAITTMTSRWASSDSIPRPERSSRHSRRNGRSRPTAAPSTTASIPKPNTPTVFPWRPTTGSTPSTCSCRSIPRIPSGTSGIPHNTSTSRATMPSPSPSRWRNRRRSLPTGPA